MTGSRVAFGSWTSPEATSASLTLLVPVGSFEQHGPHLPLDTDSRIATTLAHAAAARIADAAPGMTVVVGPTLPYGASGEHAGFPGTLSIGGDALSMVLVELMRSAGPEFARLVVINGHGGNHDAIDAAVATARHEKRGLLAWSPRLPPGGDLHAGRTETSVMLHLAPETVQLDRAEPGSTAPWTQLAPVVLVEGLRAVTANGVLGDPSGASAAEGAMLLGRWCDELLEFLSRLAADG